jgi:hypothetical protein
MYEMGSRGGYRRAKDRIVGVSAALASIGIAILVALTPTAAGVSPSGTVVYGPPFKGAVVPTTNLVAYGCARAAMPHPYHFHFKTGVGGASFAVSAKGCPKDLFRLGDYSRGTASGFAEIFVDFNHVPHGIHTVTANVSVNYAATVSEANGTLTGACPTAATSSTSGSYYDGSSWSYWPALSAPIKYTGSTYFYYKSDHGAQGSCDAWSYVQEYLQAFIVNQPNTIGYSLTPSYFPLANAYVRTQNSTYWDCSNYTLWNYGSWSNGSSTCVSNNSTATTTSYDYVSSLAGTSSSLSYSGTTAFSFVWANVSLNTSHKWLLGLMPIFNLDCYTQGYPLGHCSSKATMGPTGNGLAVKSITVS